MKSLVVSALFAATILVVAGSAAAQELHVPVYTWTGADTSLGVVVQSNLNAAVEQWEGGKRGAARRRRASPVAPTSTSVKGLSAGAPAKLAAALPADQRGEARKLYQLLLEQHPALMTQLGAREDDVAAGVATLLAGAWSAYHGRRFDDARFKPLYEQMHAAMSTDPVFARSTPADRRTIYETSAIIGTFLAVQTMNLENQPDAARSAQLKAAARRYLRMLGNLDPEKMKFTDDGLVLR